jgi:hypothetical protein
MSDIDGSRLSHDISLTIIRRYNLCLPYIYNFFIFTYLLCIPNLASAWAVTWEISVIVFASMTTRNPRGK